MRVPIWISNRHVHLSQGDADILFWKNYVFKIIKNLSQPGQFACEEVVSLKWPKWQIDGVRILGPLRKFTQVEILAADNFKLGTKAPLRLSWDLQGSWIIELIWPKGSVTLSQGLIIAKRHLHLTVAEAQEFGLISGQEISVKVLWERGLVFDNIIVRATDDSALDMHIDTEEANAAWLGAGARGEII